MFYLILKLNKLSMENNKLKDVYCESCGTKNGYYRHKTNDFVCRSCGHITEIKEKKEINGKSK